MSNKVHNDAKPDQTTTGHEWDGIKEYNTPLPRWWVWTFLACIIWAFGYYFFMPSWPGINGYLRGSLNWSARKQLNEEMAAARAANAGIIAKITASDLETIRKDPALLEFAMAGGKSAFGLYCAQCHGSGAQGAPGFPNLNDDDWLWGGTLEDIATTIRYGIRSGHDEARDNEMPAFIADEILTPEQAATVADYVVAIASGRKGSAEGAAIFEENCTACHGEGGVGDRSLGGPRLNDAIWLYGGTRKDVLAQLTRPRHGVMPAWVNKLDPATIKELAVYVHSLGGGQ